MAKSKKDKNQDVEAQTPNPTKQGGRRQFLRGAGLMGAGVIAAAATLSPLAKAAENDKVTVDVALDAEKIQAIQKCLAKGTLRISMSKAEAGNDKKTDPWLYD
jgi:hypothetical protein